jgi:hypothetical protein
MKKIAIILLTLFIGLTPILKCQTYDDISNSYGSRDVRVMEPFNLFKIENDERLYYLALGYENMSVYESASIHDSSTIVFSEINPCELLWDKSTYSNLRLVRYFDLNGDQFQDLVLMDVDGSLFYSLFDLGSNSFCYPIKFSKAIGAYKWDFWMTESVLYVRTKNKSTEVIDLNSLDYKKKKFQKRNFKEDVVLVHFNTSDSISIFWREKRDFYLSRCKNTRKLDLQNEKIIIKSTESKLWLEFDYESDLSTFVVVNNDSIWRLSGRDFRKKEFIGTAKGSSHKKYYGADLDSDGDIDPFFYSDSITVLFTKGGGKFEVQNFNIWFDLKGISFVDFDHDKNYDLFINDYSGLFVYILESGRFELLQEIRISRYFDFYYLYDIDLDGKKDLLLKSENFNEIYWSKLEGLRFSEPKTLLNSDLMRSAKAYSLD